MIIGYTTGVYDLFHIGHLNILRSAKALCDKLIVGVCPDSRVSHLKYKKPTIPLSERLEIIKAIKYVDVAIVQTDPYTDWKKLGFDILFMGDDWYKNNNTSWKTFEKNLVSNGVRIMYFPYTEGISSSKIVEKIIKAAKTMSIEHTWFCQNCKKQLQTIEGVGADFYCPFCKEWLPAENIIHTFKKETSTYTTYMSAPLKCFKIETTYK